MRSPERVHAGKRGVAERVDGDESPLVDLDARAVQPQQVGEGAAPDGHHHQFDRQRFALAERDGGRGARRVRGVAFDRHTGPDGDAAFLEAAHHDVGHVLVAAGQDLIHRFEDGDLRAEVGHHRGELAADGTAADHDGALGQLRDRQQFIGGGDEPTVEFETGDGARHRTRREDHLIALQRDGLAVGAGHGDAAIGVEGPDPAVHGDLAAFEHGGQPVEQLIDDLLLACHGDRPVEGGCGGIDPEVGGVGHMAVDRRRLEQFLGGDAADVQARAAHLGHLDQPDVETGRRAVERRRVAAWATADDHHLMLVHLVGHPDHHFRSMRAAMLQSAIRFPAGCVSGPASPAARTPRGWPSPTATT